MRRAQDNERHLLVCYYVYIHRQNVLIKILLTTIHLSCRLFPNCSFGNQCHFVHPLCVDDGRCSKVAQCPYEHSNFCRFCLFKIRTNGKTIKMRNVEFKSPLKMWKNSERLCCYVIVPLIRRGIVICLFLVFYSFIYKQLATYYCKL